MNKEYQIASTSFTSDPRVACIWGSCKVANTVHLNLTLLLSDLNIHWYNGVEKTITSKSQCDI